MKKLLENAWIVTMNPKRDVFRKGYVLVDGRKISEVGEGTYAGDRTQCEVFDMSGKLIMPGFVNSHSHNAGSLFKGLLEDNPNGFSNYALPMELNLTPEDVYYLTLVGTYESMSGGITTANEIYHYADQVAKAMDDIGTRAIIAQNIVDVNIGNIRFRDYTRDEKKGMSLLEDNIALIENWHGKDEGRITCRVGPHATDTVSLDLARKCVDVANKYGVGLHTHCAQIQRENDIVMAELGLTPVEYLREAGELGPQTIAAHCVYITDNDIKLLAESGIHLSHNTKSYAKDSVFAPMKKIYEAGVDVVLGTDWVTQDPWTNMHFAFGINRQRGVDFEHTSADFLISKFTIDSAKALGIDHITGSLETGKEADIQVIDITQPHLCPIFEDPLPLLVYNATRSDVTDVMVAGKFTIRNKVLTTMDGMQIIKDAQRVADKLYEFRTTI